MMGVSSRTAIVDFLCPLVFLFLLVTGGDAARRRIRDPGFFAFTRTSYNATIVENAPAKSFVTPADPRMGVQIDPSSDFQNFDVTFSLITNDSVTNRLFRPESRCIGDFCFLSLRTRSGAHTVINREQTDSYRFGIRASTRLRNGRSYETQSEVLVTVIDANDLSPLFDEPEYSVEVPESTPLHRSVIRLSASDADIGVNGEIYYGFSQPTDAFAIHPTSGVVTVTRKLNSNERSVYRIEVIARDRGPAPEHGSQRISKAWLVITVVTENLYAPEIVISELPSVTEHGAVGTVYAILAVRDRDQGRSGQIDVVRITRGDPDGYFSIQPTLSSSSAIDDVATVEYTIQVAKVLDREVNFDGFNLTVEATDRGRPSRSSSIVVMVHLQDVNDNAPIFAADSFQVNIEECLPVHTSILTVAASDADSDENARVTYSIADGSGLELFTIGPASGVLSIASALDAETTTSMINVTIRATDNANRGSRRIRTASVQISIMDCNDNAPVFSAIPSVIQIDENQPVGTLVFQVEAIDADSMENGFVSYSFASPDAVPFLIDPFTGKILTKVMFDYETMKRSYDIVVRASDWGTPFRRETEAIVRIRIRDINDNAPAFQKVNCTGFLSRDAPPGTEIVILSAIDFDVGSIVSYRIVSGNDDECFKLDESSGSLQTKSCAGGLRAFRGDTRTLLVTATDGVNEAAPAAIVISLVGGSGGRSRKQLASTVGGFGCQQTQIAEQLHQMLANQSNLNTETSSDDAAAIGPNHFSRNLNAPRFPPSVPRKVSIREGTGVRSISSFRAVDDDHGYNGRLQYVIGSGNDADVFRIETYSGDLYAVGLLDRELRESYLLNVTVFDMGIPRRSASILVTVAIEDVNDNAPQFERPSYMVTIPEDSAIGTSVLVVVAHDRDPLSNGRVAYRFAASGGGKFDIHPGTGLIRVADVLDRETTATYELIVLAVDHSPDSPMTGTTRVLVHIEDVNDNAPSFIPEVYRIRVLEDLPVGTVVGSVYARDLDSGAAGTVRYTIKDGADGHFDIDRMTGIIRLAREVRFDERQIFNITVRAKDRGQPDQKSSDCTVTVEVVPVNHNQYAPTFRDFVFQGRVRENQPSGTSVLQVIANDKDALSSSASPADYRIVYSIRNGTGLGRFTIDNKGMIYTREVLDRETQPFYWLTVYAQDSGMVPLSSFTEVYIEVDDVNDNIPQTPDPVYYPTVPEQSPEGTSVFQLEAKDLDDTANGALTYEIVSGNPQGFFAISRTTGLITTTKRMLDREKQDEHVLEVSISDNGAPSLSSNTRVVVMVTDDNDEAPQFLERIYRVRVPRLPTDLLHLGVYRVVAFDRDLGPNADIDYSLAIGGEGRSRGGSGGSAGGGGGSAAAGANGRFRIDKKTGMIFATRELEKDAQYDFQIKASDNGLTHQKSLTRVIITSVDLPSTSTAAPVFTSDTSVTHARVMEGDAVGHLVCIVSATDDDGDKVWYYITGGNANDAFSIDTENGNVIIARPLDWETCSEYNLTIMATDGIYQTYAMVNVTVIDINDNNPMFTQSSYTVDVGENTPPGVEILTLRATDRDEDKHLFFTIHSATSPSSLTKFKINSETGVISTLEELNHEAMSRHELTVMVRDRGTPMPKRSFARVVINVIDHNDHAPEFLATEYEGRVYSTAPIGTSVVQVLALDRDKGSNAEVAYSIISGNTGSTFAIDRTLGIVSVHSATLVMPTYQLTVQAADGGLPSLSSTATIAITVATSNSAPPVFDHSEYAVELSENQAEGTFVSAIHASCQSSIVYSLVDPSGVKFSIDPSSGVIFTGELLDYEQAPLHNLTIRATNIAGAFATATLLVHVVDVNDNRPVFLQRSYVGNVSEASAAGSYVVDSASETHAPLVVRATDADSGVNALLVYRITDPLAQDVFEIDAATGAIRTKVVLDRELRAVYRFGVQVSDSGTPSKSADIEADVMIFVDDVNDSPPVFTQQTYEATVLLPTYSNVIVVQVNATDADSPDNTVLEYTIENGNTGRRFHLDPRTGVLTLRDGASDAADMLDKYSLSVRVSDGKFSGSATINVNVDILQSTGLQFVQGKYQVEIPENVSSIEQVVLLQAVGYALNEHVTFSLLNAGEQFTIHPTSGVIRTTGISFDRELRDSYVIVAEVRDGRTPPRIAHTLLHVNISDVNDNVPMFVQQPYFAMVSTDAAIGDVVRKVTAIDRDAGNNSHVDYFLVDGDGTFAVRSDTGEIIVSALLALHEHNRQHRLVIEARDRGEPILSARADVTVTIVNKAMPVFEDAFYSVSVPENLAPFSVLLTVSAKSPSSNSLVYSIVKGNTYNEFGVDFSIGTITLIDQLDYETNQKYELTIRATDIITGSHADTVVHIQVEDVNDHKPVFEKPQYVADISEAAPIGTSVLTVTATDADSGSNARLTYRAEPHPASPADVGFFYVDADRGLVLVRQRLDREQTPRLQFIVVATDAGIPAMSSSVSVTVTIGDVNDNPPKFDQPAYEATVSDQAKRGQFVVAVRASDADITDQGKLTYSIVGGNSRQSFAIDTRTGVLSVSNLGRRATADLQSTYVVNVSASDGIYTAFSRVKVSVEGSNTVAPTFPHVAYDVDIAENLPAGHSVITLLAVDSDRGQYGEVTYKIIGEDADELFSIDSLTGTITTKVPLDREVRDLHEVRVAAVDGGGRAGYTVVRVHIADQSDNIPTFMMSDYKANVYSMARIGTTFLTVSVSDSDPSVTRNVEYSIFADDSKAAHSTQYFTIDSTTGIVSTKTSLTGSQNTAFQFFVRGKNKMNPLWHSDVPVEIYVMGAADHPPTFDQDLFRFNVIEGSPASTVVATVTARSNATLRYQLLAPSNEVHTDFAIDDFGVVTTTKSLDREIVALHELTVRAETLASPPLVAHARFIVHVIDVNDNAPKFEAERYYGVVAENGNPGASVVQVVAHDPDAGRNAEFIYELANDTAPALTSLFTCDAVTGWITVTSSLDRETFNEYRFNVVAIDRGTPRLSSVVEVIVAVSDENDNAPVFAQLSYSGAVNEDALPGTIILVVTATDADIAPNNVMSYHIAGGDLLGQFGVRRSGEIYVNKLLDRETHSQYELIVLASDGAFVATAAVSITILDANDNAPVCEQESYEAQISENVSVNSFVARVAANDSDEPGTRNARVEFSLESNELDMFYIHKRTGVISTKKPLDRETVPEYHLIAVAQDGGGLACRAAVHILLIDVNDNAPRFVPRSTYSASVSEDAVVGTPVLRVSAVDPDLGVNRQIRYGLEMQPSGMAGGVFTVDAVSGVVSLLQTLDREENSVYTLNVIAFDQGTPSLTSIATVSISVVDVNDNPPEFERTVYALSVSEATPVGTSVGRVYATSRDVGVNAEISYTVVDTIGGAAFTINSSSGSVIVASTLDYELVKEYVMTIEASDGGSPSLSSTAVVRINVIDANDNRPLFSIPKYVSVVREDVAVNTSLLQVKAIDNDEGANGQIEYRLVGGDPNKHFTVNPRLGSLIVSAPLDRETIASYDLEIIAVDNGVPALTSTAKVKVQLLDVNDSPPKFTNNNFTATVQVDGKGNPLPAPPPGADTSIGTSVFALSVTDADQEPNGAPFTYDIDSGNHNEFYIDRSGVICTATKFNRQIKDTYELTVRVFDNGTPPLYSEAHITILIVEQSTSPPVITPLAVTITVAGDGIFQGGVVGRVRAFDRDVSDQLVFAIVNDEDRRLFDIDTSDGMLRAVQGLDVGDYIINVSVSDGKFVRYADVRIAVDGIAPEAKDNAIVVRLDELTPEEFVDHHMDSFILALRSELTVRDSDIKILSIQPAPGSNPIRATLVRRRRAASDSQQLDVLLAVQKSDAKFYRANTLRRRVEAAAKAVEQQADIHIVRVFNSVCTKESCSGAEYAGGADCTTVVLLDNSVPLTIVTDRESFVSIKHQLVQKCVCRSGATGSSCGLPPLPPDPKICTPGLCVEPKICRSDGQSYTCSCPEGRGGEECQNTIDLPCRDPSCGNDKPMTFSGNSYARWRLTVPMERRLSLSLELKTLQQKARLMHAVGRVDYSILEIEDGAIQYRFDCGSGPGVIRADKRPINDGIWHTVIVERISKNVRITVDGVLAAEGSGPGTNDVLNLDSNDVFFGAEVATLAHGFEDIRQGFVGCMQRIKIDLVELRPSGSSSVGVLQNLQDIEFQCRGSSIPGVCSSIPCQNGGSCMPLGVDSFLCKCRGRFTGLVCEIDPNPCASNPCLNGGTCENVNNDFRCRCKGRIKGSRCELFGYCDNDPCSHDGQCVEGLSGPLCQCTDAYQGEFCDDDVNECEAAINPCPSDSPCVNTDGGFVCSNCSAGDAACLMFPTKTVTSAIGISREEAIGIAVVALVLLIIALIVVLLARWRHRKRHAPSGTCGDTTDAFAPCDVDADLCSAEFGSDKMSCGGGEHSLEPNGNVLHGSSIGPMCRGSTSPRPPPLPKRPVSYTPSTADSVNGLSLVGPNFDSIRRTNDYGSAADDLENAGCHDPIVIPDFMRNPEGSRSPSVPIKRTLPPPPSANSEAASKVLNNLNKAENYRKNPDKMRKVMPAATNQSMQSLQLLQTGADGTSVASLPISESEDDMQDDSVYFKRPAYHWDTSDWNPSAMPLLPKPPHLGGSGLRISPTSSHHSTDYNVDIDPNGYDFADFTDPGDDSEYVNDDSEFTENEMYDDDGDDEPNIDFPPVASASLNFQQILAMRDDLNYGTDDRRLGTNGTASGPRRRRLRRGGATAGYSVHPNEYLPAYNISLSGSVGQSLVDDGAAGNFDSADFICRDDDDDVIHYGFPTSASMLRPRRQPGDDADGNDTALDSISVSMSGHNTSELDLAGVCEIEDSEANMSDVDEGAAGAVAAARRLLLGSPPNNNNSSRINNASSHTPV